MLTPAAAYALARDLGRRHAAHVPATFEDAQPCAVDSQGDNFRPCAPHDDAAHYADEALEYTIWKRIGKVPP